MSSNRANTQLDELLLSASNTLRVAYERTLIKKRASLLLIYNEHTNIALSSIIVRFFYFLFIVDFE